MKQVGPYEVKSVTVETGLTLLMLASDENKTAEFNTRLILASVTRDGQPINSSNFADVMPYLNELVSAAMEVNGFRKDDEQPVA